jgi:hypothetical protein
MTPSAGSEELEIRHHARESLRALVPTLRSNGLLPAPLAALDPEYLAEGFEGENTAALVAYADGAPVAYMPYVVRRNNFRVALGSLTVAQLPFRQLRLFGYSARGNAHEPILDAFFTWLVDHETWHVAQLFDLPVDHPLCRYVAARAGAGRRYHLASQPFDTLQIRIERDFETYLHTHFTKKSRYNLKREVRLLEDAAPGQVVMKVYTAGDEAEEFLRHAESIARLTYQWKLGLTTLRADPAEIRRTKALASQGKWRSYILFIAGAPAAFCYATIRWGDLSYDTIGYDPQFAKLNPGKALLYKILEDLHACRGVAHLEFGRGPAEYKQLFATSSRRILDVSVYLYRPYPQLLRLVAAAINTGHRWLRPAARPWMPSIKRRLQTLRLLIPALPNALEIVAELSL